MPLKAFLCSESVVPCLVGTCDGGGGGGALLVDGAAGAMVGLATGIAGGNLLARLFSVGEPGDCGSVGLSMDKRFCGRDAIGGSGGAP